MTLVIRHKVSARSFLHPMCTYGTLLHPTCACGTYSYSSMTLVIRHKVSRLVLSPCDVYLWDHSQSDVYLWDLQFIIKVSTRSFLHPTCTYGTLLHPTSGARWLTCHMYLWNRSPSPSDLWDPMVCVSCVPMGPSDLWDPTAYMSRVPVGPFSISIRFVGPDGLRVTYCRRGLINSNSKKNHETWELNPGPRARNRPSSPLR